MSILASNGSQSDVQAKLNAAADGDTVTLPAGTFTWTAGVSTTKNLTIQGSGYTGSSVAGAPASLPTVINFTATGTPLAVSVTMAASIKSKIFRLSGISFIGVTVGSGAGPGYVIINNTPASDAYRVDNCSFDAGATTGAILITVYGNGPGVIDHCTISSGNGSEMIHNGGMTAGNNAGWLDDLVPGSAAMVFVEDCVFNKNPAVDQYFWGTCAMQGYYGARTVMRYCTFNYCAIDQHGGGGAVGVRWFEFYHNTFVVPLFTPPSNWSTYIILRAGSGFVYDNVAMGSANDGNGIIQLYSDDAANPPPYGPGAGIFVGGNPNGIKSPVYLWNNTQTVPGQPAQIPATATTSNVTSGVNFFGSVSKPGTLIVAQTAATAAGVAFAYTPYQYPHPLNQPVGGGAVATNLERASFANLKYGRTNVTLASTTGITVGQVMTITTTNGGTMTGTVKKFCGSTGIKLGDCTFNRPSSFLLLPKGSAIA